MLNLPELKLPKSIRMCRELNAAALTSKEDRGLVLWYFLRSLDVSHTGTLTFSENVPKLRRIGYTSRTIFRTLEEKAFFYSYHNTRTGEGKIHINSFRSVIEAMKVNLPPRARWVEVPIKAIPQPNQVGKWRALLFNVSAYKPFGTDVRHPQTRRTIEEATGIKDRQQRRYDKRIGTSRLPVRFLQRDVNGTRISPVKIIVESSGHIVSLKENLFYSVGSKGASGQTSNSEGTTAATVICRT